MQVPSFSIYNYKVDDLETTNLSKDINKQTNFKIKSHIHIKIKALALAINLLTLGLGYLFVPCISRLTQQALEGRVKSVDPEAGHYIRNLYEQAKNLAESYQIPEQIAQQAHNDYQQTPIIGLDTISNWIHQNELAVKESLIILAKAMAEQIPALKDLLDKERSLTDQAHSISKWLNENQTSLDLIKRLNLSNKKLTHLPPEIKKCRNLEKLNCSKNLLTLLPKEIGELNKLMEFDCSSNQLTSFPSSITNCVDLWNFNCSDNQLTSLADDFSNFIKLEVFNCNNNQLVSLPNSINKCEQLQMLFCAYNHLTSLPEQIGRCPNLSWLICQNNPLQSLPESIDNKNLIGIRQASRIPIHRLRKKENLMGEKHTHITSTTPLVLKNKPKKNKRVNRLSFTRKSFTNRIFKVA